MASLLKAFGNQLNPAGVPNGKLSIDWNHQLSKGLIFCRVGDQTIDVTGINGTGVAGSVGGNTLNKPSFSKEGPALQTQSIGAASGIDIEFGSVPPLYTGGDVTFVSRFVFQSASSNTGSYSSALAYGKSANVIYTLGIVQSTGLSVFEVQNSGASYQNVFGAAPVVNAINHWTGIIRGANVLIFQENQAPASNPYTGVPANGDSTFTLAVGRDWYTTDAGRWLNALHHLNLVYNRALSDDEIFYLYNNPYCFLIPAEYELPAIRTAAAPLVVLLQPYQQVILM
jgi:hypothetical protein